MVPVGLRRLRVPPGHAGTAPRGDSKSTWAAYQAAVGPSAGKGIVDYLRGRSDKACAVLTTAIRTVTADLAAPYGVFLR
jgi:hypothetical protein